MPATAAVARTRPRIRRFMRVLSAERDSCVPVRAHSLADYLEPGIARRQDAISVVGWSGGDAHANGRATPVHARDTQRAAHPLRPLSHRAQTKVAREVGPWVEAITVIANSK